MATIKDVAKLAGVSITTVSRVMNDRGYISSVTKKKVYDAMATLDYHPHQIARALSKKQSFLIGLILPDSSLSFFAQMVRSIEKTAQNNGYKILLCNSLNNHKKEQEYINMLKENRVDGIIMGSHASQLTSYASLNRPVITFERYIEGIPYVTADNTHGGTLATEHLIERGCKKLLHISGPLELNILSNRRADAFRVTCLKYGIDHEIVEYEYTHLEYDYYSSYISKHVMPIIHKYDGVFCSNDLLAYALYTSCTKAGIRVPESIKIVGYDHCLFAQMLQTPKLTTIAQPIDLIGESLCNGIISVIEDKPFYNQQLPVTLIEGETT